MGMLSGFFKDLEKYLIFLLNYDYMKIIYIFLVALIVYFITISILYYKLRKELKTVSNEMKKINLESNYYNDKRKYLTIYGYVFVFISFLYISKDNIEIILPIFTTILIIILFSVKEQLNNIILGIIFKSSFNTSIYEDMEFYFKDNVNEVCKLSKINLFKSIYRNQKTGMVYSIENKQLNSDIIIHKPLKTLDRLEYKYIISTKLPVEKYITEVKELLKEDFKNQQIDYKLIKDSLYEIKHKFNTSPYMKPFYEVNLKYLTHEQLEITIVTTLYNYNYDKYNDNYLRYRPVFAEWSIDKKE